MKKYRGKLKVIVEKTGTGFSAFSDKHGVYSTGKSITELTSNMEEAFNLHFEDHNIEVGPNNIDLYFDLGLFFKHYPVINAKFLANKIGMNYTLLSQYVQGRKKPSAKQTEKIMKGIHEIGAELSELNLLISDRA